MAVKITDLDPAAHLDAYSGTSGHPFRSRPATCDALP
jgi:hypothetical protein